MVARVRSQLKEVFRLVGECRLDQSSRAWRKAELLNLLVEVYRVYIQGPKKFDPTETARNLSTFFARVDRAGAGGPEAEEVVSYYKAAIQATNDRSNRIRRGQVISKILNEGITF